ncbi:MAG: histidinol phosphate phosphatase [Bacillota bacterium]|nr:histidinol phosphate phosphatase [Bacillota bacterium]
MFDTHVHTTFSTDSKMTLEEALRTAEEKGMGVTLTEHMDLNCRSEGKFVFDIDKYFSEYERFRGPKLLLGIELGLTEEFREENKRIADNNPFDYVIGSIHFLGNYDIYYPEFYDGMSKSEAYREYLLTMKSNICGEKFFDSLGHIDFICRYAPYEDKEIYMEEYGDYVDEVLKALIASNIAMEINTRRLNDRAAVKNLLSIYMRYKALGGEFVTIGSDAHTPKAIGFNYRSAVEIAERASLKAVYFRERKMEYMTY